MEIIHNYRIGDFHRSGVQIKEEEGKVVITLISSNQLGNKLQAVTCAPAELNEIIVAIKKYLKSGEKNLDQYDEYGMLI
tara:strand:- start:385 stop:621 length:237 start_codon:yes stop_codon:yes gene_type:complete